jgi:hypothetical protein
MPKLEGFAGEFPAITPVHLELCVVSEDYHVFPGTTLTVCCLTLENGYTVTGQSACVHAGNFDPVRGRQVARKNAVDNIWALEGYLLRQRLFEEQQGA